MAKTTVFSQLIKIIPRTVFENFVQQTQADKGVRRLDSWTWFGALLFSQCSKCDSVRSIERVFSQDSSGLRSLGFSAVKKSTLADANQSRPSELLERVFQFCLGLAKKQTRSCGFDFPGELVALDSTFLRLCLSLSPWAMYRRSPKGNNKYEMMNSAGVKIHTGIDLAGDLPNFVVIREGREKENGDLKVAREKYKPKPGSTTVMDRGYWNIDWFAEFEKSGAFFITRECRRVQFRVAKSHKTNRTLGILCDQEIYFNGKHSRGRYPGVLRRISYREPDTGKKLIFITNRFDLSAETICDVYKARWRIETFFKCLKQNLHVKRFMGFSLEAVKAQVWAALIAYLLVAIARMTVRSSIYIREAISVIGTLLLLKMDLKHILADIMPTLRHPPPLQQEFSF